MSRIAKAPVELPQGVEFKQDGTVVTIKGSKGSLSLELNTRCSSRQEDAPIGCAALRITIRTAVRVRLVHCSRTWCTALREGFERKLELVGVGYRAQAQGSKLNLTLGFLTSGRLRGA